MNSKFLKLYDYVGDANKEGFIYFFNNIFEDEKTFDRERK
jgi:hypothetical protein